MTIREDREQIERMILSPYAAFSAESKGRPVAEEPCSLRPVYQRDRDRILHCKAFRRMKHKTQVFLAPTGDHYRTRLTHTLEVAQIARSIARSLRLNEDLTEAIALGHDLGHPPFGHAGESVLNELSPDGFAHYEQSVRVAQVLEKDGKGLNLTYEVCDGILNHGTARMPATLEGKIVRLSDKIAYINHDIDDAIRGQIINEKDIPVIYTDILGTSSKMRLNTLITDVIENSMGKPDILMSDEIQKAMLGIRQYMFENVYTNPKGKSQDKKAQNVLRVLYHYFMKHPEQLPEENKRMMAEHGITTDRAVCDYLSGMTDQYTIELFEDIYVPKAWRIY